MHPRDCQARAGYHHDMCNNGDYVCQCNNGNTQNMVHTMLDTFSGHLKSVDPPIRIVCTQSTLSTAVIHVIHM